MLSYWILRDRNDAAVGLVRLENDRVLLKPTAAPDCVYRLFSDEADTPLLPFSETRFENAEAVIGFSEDAPCVFAAASDAKPMSAYLTHLSRNCTMPETSETPPDADEPAEPAAEAETPKDEEPESLPDISDTAREAEAFALLLRRANDFYARFDRIHLPNVDNLVHKEDNSAEPARGIDLFPQAFPGARWRYTDGGGRIGHYEGIYRYPSGERVRILAVRGRCAPRPPRTLSGFTRYLRADDGTGYWLRLLPLDDDGC